MLHAAFRVARPPCHRSASSIRRASPTPVAGRLRRATMEPLVRLGGAARERARGFLQHIPFLPRMFVVVCVAVDLYIRCDDWSKLCFDDVVTSIVNGKPTCANKGLLTTILRDTWKWDGFVVSDYDVRSRFSSRAPIPSRRCLCLLCPKSTNPVP